MACGIDYSSGKSRLAISAEYFSGINTYHLLKPDSDPFVYPPSWVDSANIKPLIDSYLQVENAAKPVLNVAIGFSRELYRQFTLQLGSSTDFSSYDQPSGENELIHGFGAWNIYHISSGLSYRKQKHTITLGFSYAFTPSRHIPPYASINQTADPATDALLTAKSYSIVLGYTYYFSKAE
jgi:hypothetical protein